MEEKFSSVCFPLTWFKFIGLHAVRHADPPWLISPSEIWPVSEQLKFPASLLLGPKLE